MIDSLIARFVMWWCKSKLKESRQKHRGYQSIYEIKGTGKDYPNYLMFTDVERVRNEMMEI